jgi:very-short-patch-repair endonuclease
MPTGIPKNGINAGHFKKGISPWIKGKTTKTSSVLLRMGKKHSEYLKDLFHKGALVPWNKGKTKENDPRVARGATSLIKKWAEDSEYSTSQRKALSKGALKRWKSKDQLKKRSDYTKFQWKQDDYKRKQMKARNEYPNKSEQQLGLILNQIGKFKYVGDGALFIGKRCPDFIDEEHKLIVELFGEPFHEIEDVNRRRTHYTYHGYKCITIWSAELKNKTRLKNKIIKWLRDKV